ELRGALGDQAVPLPDDGSVLQLAGDDDLAAVPERIRHGALVLDRNALARVVAIGNAEIELLSLMRDGARDDLAGQLELVRGRRAEQVGGLLRLGRRAE